MILSLNLSILTPIAFIAFIVCKTSLDISRLEISEIPLDIEGIIIDRWDIDLSPGILTQPCNPFIIFELISI